MKVSVLSQGFRTVGRESGSTLARLSKDLSRLTLLAVFSVSATTLWAADDTTPAAEDRDELVTEFRGRPPFNRRFVSSEETAELARFEESAPEPTAAGIWVVDYRGRPPFKREFLSAEEIVDLARFEEASSSEEQDRGTRRGPPGKPGSRR